MLRKKADAGCFSIPFICLWLFEMNLEPARNNTFIPAEDCQWMMRVSVDWKLCILGNYSGRRPKFLGRCFTPQSLLKKLVNIFQPQTVWNYFSPAVDTYVCLFQHGWQIKSLIINIQHWSYCAIVCVPPSVL